MNLSVQLKLHITLTKYSDKGKVNINVKANQALIYLISKILITKGIAGITAVQIRPKQPNINLPNFFIVIPSTSFEHLLNL